jgi:cysteinyl-tRNA synthetase
MIADKNISQENKLKTILSFDEVLGLDIKNLINKKDEILEIGKDVKNLLEERDTARKEKDWKKSDEIRDEIKKLGFEVKDTEKGQVLEKI